MTSEQRAHTAAEFAVMACQDESGELDRLALLAVAQVLEQVAYGKIDPVTWKKPRAE